MPLAELERRIAELQRDREIVAYCRGPFCLLFDEAVELPSARRFTIRKISECHAAVIPVERRAAA